jgi:hypothetical protein
MLPSIFRGLLQGRFNASQDGGNASKTNDDVPLISKILLNLSMTHAISARKKSNRCLEAWAKRTHSNILWESRRRCVPTRCAHLFMDAVFGDNRRSLW